jgi:hypothetical protein
MMPFEITNQRETYKTVSPVSLGGGKQRRHDSESFSPTFVQELLQGHIGRSLACTACVVKQMPSLTEVVVLREKDTKYDASMMGKKYNFHTK